MLCPLHNECPCSCPNRPDNWKAKKVIYPVTDFADRVEPDTEKLKARIFELERILAVIHEHSKI